MLDDGRCRRFELAHQLPGCVKIDQVVVREFFTVQLLARGHTEIAQCVECRFLVRILTVAKARLSRGYDSQLFRKRFCAAGIIAVYERKTVCNGGVIGGGMLEGLFRESPVSSRAETRSVRSQLGRDLAILAR